MTDKRMRSIPRYARVWLVLLPVWSLMVLACGAGGGTIVIGPTSTTHPPSKATALVLVGTQSGLFAYPVPDDGSGGRQYQWKFPWPTPSCPACYFTIDHQDIFAAAGPTLTKLDAAGKVLAQVKLAGNAVAAPIVMDQSGEVMVVTDQGIQETAANAPQSPSAPVAYAKSVAGTMPFIATTAMYVAITVGSELAALKCNAEPQDSIQVIGQKTLNGAAIGPPQFAQGYVLVPMASGVADVAFQGDQGYGPERDIPWPGNGSAGSEVATQISVNTYLASGNQLAQYDASSGKLLRSSALPGDLMSQLVLVGPKGYVATSQGIASWDDGNPLDPSNGPPIIWPHGFVVPTSPPPPPNANLPALLATTNAGDLLAISDGNDTVALRPLVVPPTHTAFVSDGPVLSVGVLALG